MKDSFGGEIVKDEQDEFDGFGGQVVPFEGAATNSPTPQTEQQDVSNFQSVPPVDTEKGFLERFEEDRQERIRQTTDIFESASSQTVPETALQIVGKTFAGTALDFVGEGLVSAFRSLPDAVENPIRDAASELLQSDIGKAGIEKIIQGTDEFEEWAIDNPRAARNIESIVNIGLLFAPVKKGKVKLITEPEKPTTLGRAAKSIENTADAQVAAKKVKVAQDLVRPKQTAAVRTEQVSRETEEGLLGGVVTAPSQSEARIIDEVAKLPGLSSSNTLRSNFKIIQDANRAEAVFLKDALKNREIIFPRKEFNTRLGASLKSLESNPLLVGDARKSADKVVLKMRQLLNDNKSTGSGLLQARKELDTWVRGQKGAGIFDPAKENALSIAVRDIRSTTNDFLAEKAVSVPVKESLSKQSALFSALDSIAPKAADEGRGVISRAIQNISEVIPIPVNLRQGLAATGLLAIPAITSPTTAATVLAVGLGGKAAISAARSSTTKRMLSGLLRQTDKAIQASKSTPALLIKLRSDRAALLEIMDTVINDEK